MKAKVSVIVPSHNLEGYISESIESVLQQSFADFELVVIDDCSHDRSVEKVKAFRDERIKLLVNSENIGAAATYNLGIIESTADLVCFFSSDDIFDRRKLERQVEFMETHNEVAACTTLVDLIDDSGRKFSNRAHPYFDIFARENRSRHEWLRQFFLYGNCLAFNSSMVRRSALEDVGFLNPFAVQLLDFDLWIRICMKYEIYVIQENLFKFRVRKHNGNASGDKPEKKARMYWEYEQLLNDFLRISPADLAKVFPESLQLVRGGQLEQWHTPYVLGKVALALGEYEMHKRFGIEMLFRHFGEQREKYEEIQKVTSLSYKEVTQHSHVPYMGRMSPQAGKEWGVIAAPDAGGTSKLRLLVAYPSDLDDPTVSLYFRDVVFPSYRIEFKAVTEITSDDLVDTGAAVIVRDIFGSLPLFKLLVAAGIPAYWFIDDNFLVLSKSDPAYSAFEEERIRNVLKGWAGVIASSQNLLSYLNAHRIHKKVMYLPPCSEPLPRLQRHLGRKSERVGICFLGGAHRVESFKRYVIPALRELSQTKDLNLLIFGGFRLKGGKGFRTYNHPTMPLRAVYRRMISLDIGIIVHPGTAIENNSFKVPTALLAGNSVSACVVASSVPPYTEIPDAVLLAEDSVGSWLSVLRKAIDDDQLRLRTLARAREICRTKYGGDANFSLFEWILANGRRKRLSRRLWRRGRGLAGKARRWAARRVGRLTCYLRKSGRRFRRLFLRVRAVFTS